MVVQIQIQFCGGWGYGPYKDAAVKTIQAKFPGNGET